MAKIKVLIVDDSTLIRKIVKDLLTEDRDFEVVGTAKNGKEAIEFIQNHSVDVVTLDIEMPVMDGLETLKEIMRIHPLPVVMLSSITEEGANMTFKALDLGAVDFISKPANIFDLSSAEMHNDLKESLRQASKARLRKKPIVQKKEEDSKDFFLESRIRKNGQEISKIIAIGTSTGGPRALQEVIAKLSGKIDAPVLVVQHMPKGFTKSLAERLNALSQLRVKEAEDREPLVNGTVYIAPGDKHLKILSTAKNRYCILLDDGAHVSGHKPSVDAMFYSLSEEAINDITAVVMTGMGADGAKGIERLKDVKKSYNIVEDESTCVVFGMPKSAIATGKVDKVVPLNKIAIEINKLMGV